MGFCGVHGAQSLVFCGVHGAQSLVFCGVHGAQSLVSVEFMVLSL
jgi:hypothetical protein